LRKQQPNAAEAQQSHSNHDMNMEAPPPAPLRGGGRDIQHAGVPLLSMGFEGANLGHQAGLPPKFFSAEKKAGAHRLVSARAVPLPSADR
jgi:hypothetical protein